MTSASPRVERLALADVEPALWHELLAACPDSTVFQRLEWLSAWHAAVKGGSGEAVAYVVRETGQVVAAAPLWFDPAPASGGPAVRLLGAEHADYQCFPTRDGRAGPVAILLDAIEADCRDRGAVDYGDVPEHSALARCLAARARRDIRYAEFDRTPCPRLDVRGNADLPGLLGRESLRRIRNRLARRGALRILHDADRAAIEARLETLFDQHVRRWGPTGCPSLFEAPHNRAFYRALAAGLPAGTVLFSTVEIDGAAVATHFGLRSRNELIWYKPAFEPALARLSPGQVLLAALMERAAAEGLDALDFSRGDEAFKARYTTSVRYNRNYRWTPNVVVALLRRAKGEAKRWRDDARSRAG